MSRLLDIMTIESPSWARRVLLSRRVRLACFASSPNTLTRLHALTKADNVGLGLVVIGLLPQVGSLRGWS